MSSEFRRFRRTSSIPLRPCNKWINSVRISMEDMDQLPGASDSDRSQFGEMYDVFECVYIYIYIYVFLDFTGKNVFLLRQMCFSVFVDATYFFTFTTYASLYIHVAVLLSFCSGCGVAPHLLMQNWTSAGMQHWELKGSVLGQSLQTVHEPSWCSIQTISRLGWWCHTTFQTVSWYLVS